MNGTDNNNLAENLVEALGSVLPLVNKEKYPIEAMPVGTLARSTRLDRLGLITDAFYGDVDANDKKIIVYTMLLFPNTSLKTKSNNSDIQYYVSNEYEYEVIGYLMVGPLDVRKIAKSIDEGIHS